MKSIIFIVLGTLVFLIYTGMNAIVICNIMENYKSGFDYFSSVLKDRKINFFGKIVFVIFNLLFPIAILISILDGLTFYLEEGGYAKLKKWFKRVFAKK